MVMVVCAGFMCLAQTAFAAQRFGQDSAVYVWMVFCMLVAFAIGFLLLARSRYPRATFVAACVVVLVFPYDPILALMALTALLARRNDTKTTVRAIVAGGFVTLAAQVRDALRPPEASIWHMVFAKPDTGSQYGTDLIMLADDRTIVITAIVAALLELAIATLGGCISVLAPWHRWPRPRRTRRTRRWRSSRPRSTVSSWPTRSLPKRMTRLPIRLPCWR